MLADHASGIYDVTFLEEAVDMPPEHYLESMRPQHKCIYAEFGLEFLCVPAQRLRFNAAA